MFIITPSTSILSNTGPAIGSASTNNFVLVTDAAYAVTADLFAYAIELTDLYQTITIAGHVAGQGGGILLGELVAATEDNGGQNLVTIAANGTVTGDLDGLTIYGGDSDVTNAGHISASNDGVAMYGEENHLQNSGTIVGNYGFFGDDDEGLSSGRVTNSGTISGDTQGIFIESNYQITNTGIVTARSGAIRTGGSGNSIDNSGTISVGAQGSYGVFFESAFGEDNELSNSGTIANHNASGYAIRGDGGNESIRNLAGGEINGAIGLQDGADRIENAGAIHGDVDLGSGTFGGDTLDNTGDIYGDVVLSEGNDDVRNFGMILGQIDMGLGVIDEVTNAGTISGGLALWDDTDIVNNSGTIGGDINKSAGAAFFVNSGHIGGSVFMFSGTGHSVSNSGTIAGFLDLGGATVANSVHNSGSIGSDVILGAGNDTLGNDDGEIGGSVTLGGGTDRLDNTNGRIGGTVDLGASDDTLMNIDGVLDGAVLAGDGNDTIASTGGVIRGPVDLGSGNDTFTGGGSADSVTGGFGIDVVTLGGGDDTFTAGIGVISGTSDGNDEIDAGDGIDTYHASIIGTAMTIDLDDGYATGTRIGTDSISGFENAFGGTSNDIIIGNAGANRLTANSGNDSVSGGDGNDTIFGGNGADTIVGGLGRDLMSGGTVTSTNSDVFVFGGLADSGTTAATRDIISDFQDGLDKIDLSGIDADTGTGANDAFSFIGAAAFSNVAGELRVANYSGGVYVLGDVNGDGSADVSVALRGTHSLTATDFLL
jgi:hypothetical protein